MQRNRFLSHSDVFPVKIAAIGCGYWGKNLVRNFAELDALAAIVDPDGKGAGPLGKKYGAPVEELSRVLRDPQIGAVAIAAPAVQHATLAAAAIEAGTHVFVETPRARPGPAA